jgi:hypothetical protein
VILANLYDFLRLVNHLFLVLLDFIIIKRAVFILSKKIQVFFKLSHPILLKAFRISFATRYGLISAAS